MILEKRKIERDRERERERERIFAKVASRVVKKSKIVATIKPYGA